MFNSRAGQIGRRAANGSPLLGYNVSGAVVERLAAEMGSAARYARRRRPNTASRLHNESFLLKFNYIHNLLGKQPTKL